VLGVKFSEVTAPSMLAYTIVQSAVLKVPEMSLIQIIISPDSTTPIPLMVPEDVILNVHPAS
jgi:hypothetical protein